MSTTIERLQPEELEVYKQRVRAVHQGTPWPERAGGYDGFGETHSLNKWVELLGVPKTSLWRYLQKGLTIEEVCELRGIDYPAAIPF